MAWLLSKAADTLKKAQEKVDQLQDSDFVQKFAEVDFVQKARDAANQVAEAANKVSESVQAEYRRTFEELDCQIYTLRPDLVIMEYPSAETIERLAKRLNESYAQKMLIFNFSEDPYESGKFDGEVLDISMQKMEVPPLKLVVELCLTASQWLATDSGNLLVLHCRSGYGRSGLFGACFESFRTRRSPKEALQTITERLPVQLLPSQQRYLGYFHQFLEGVTPQPKRLHLSKVLLSGVPSFEAEGSVAFRPFIEVWVAGELAYSSFKGGKSDEVVWPSSYASSDSVVAFPLPSQLIVFGDVLIQVFHLYLDAKRELAMKLAFHTNFITEGLQLSKFELDAACTDERFTDDFFVDLVFEEVPKNEDSTEEEEKVQQAAAEDAAIFEKARAASVKLREEAAQQAAEAEDVQGEPEGDVEAELEAMLLRGGPAESPKEMTNGGGGTGGDEELRQALAAAAEESEQKADKPVEKVVERAPAAAQAADKSGAKSAEIDTLFSEFDAVLAGGTKGDAAKGGGYSEAPSKPAASTSKAAEKKDMFAEVDDFLKELDGGTGSGTK
ncbi:Tns3 [Symbiodinium natans]|uniref:Tns3 protein n=1 Tax=Symbiodinium natans TaxID=878477 RepID=A0A812UMA6_9DINO|nr:Tns3 [Symbiodinium natans]